MKTIKEEGHNAEECGASLEARGPKPNWIRKQPNVQSDVDSLYDNPIAETNSDDT